MVNKYEQLHAKLRKNSIHPLLLQDIETEGVGDLLFLYSSAYQRAGWSSQCARPQHNGNGKTLDCLSLLARQDGLSVFIGQTRISPFLFQMAKIKVMEVGAD